LGPILMFCPPGLVFGGSEGVRTSLHVLRDRTHFSRYQGRQLPFSCFAVPDSFSAVPRAWAPVFMFCAPGHIFGGTESVGSRFHVLRARTHFLRYRGRWVPVSCFALPDSFSAVPRASAPVFMFCAHRLIFDDTEGVGTNFHVLCTRTHFLRYQGRWLPFFMFCGLGLVFGGTEGVGSRFHVLRSRSHFRRYQCCRLPFSCFALPNSFSAVPTASGPVFMFCAPGLIFSGTEGDRSRFHVLRSLTHFRWCRVRRVPFSCFVRPDSFSAVSRAIVPVFKFCAPRLIFG
jgi:hypothetical protein